MIQISKAGPLKCPEFIHCFYLEKAREQMKRKQTLKCGASAGRDCWSAASYKVLIFEGWLAQKADLPSPVSRFGGADVCAVSCEISPGDVCVCRQLRLYPPSGYSHPPREAAFKP